jgi:AcrR family transcriptional regulator
MSTQAYRRRGAARSQATRDRIIAAVRQLLAEGVFHSSTVEQVADRAGVSRATVYQHFRSRIDLVDAICETFDANPALLELRDTVALEDPARALAGTIELTVRFWSSEHAVLAQLYGIVALDEAAADLVARQRADRSGEMRRLARTLARSRALRMGVSEPRAHELLLVLTSYETFRELRAAGLTDRRIIALLQGAAGDLLAAGRR